jgi:hypothetical protein
MRRRTQESERWLSASGKNRLTHRRYPNGRLLTPSGGPRFYPRGRLGTRAGRGVVRAKAADYSEEALILVFRFRGNAARRQRPGHGEQDWSCRNPFGLMKSW